jgi:hypothetical protein
MRCNHAKCSKYHTKCKVTIPKRSKYHAKWQILVPNCCKYKANGTRKKSKFKAKKIQNLSQKKSKNYSEPIVYPRASSLWSNFQRGYLKPSKEYFWHMKWAWRPTISSRSRHVASLPSRQQKKKEMANIIEQVGIWMVDWWIPQFSAGGNMRKWWI